MLENIVNWVIRSGLVIPYFKFTFAPMDVEIEAEERKFALDEFKAGAITLDQYLETQDKPPLPEGRGKVHIFQSRNLTVYSEEEGTLEAELQKSIKREQDLRRRLRGGAIDDEDE